MAGRVGGRSPGPGGEGESSSPLGGILVGMVMLAGVMATSFAVSTAILAYDFSGNPDSYIGYAVFFFVLPIYLAAAFVGAVLLTRRIFGL